MNKNIESALSLDAHVFLHNIEKADILVGIPSYNNILTASYVLSQVVKGLDTYFPNMKSAIFVSDGNSADETLTSVKKVHLPSEVKLIPAIYMGTSGKGTAVRAIFEAASTLNVRSVALVDSDLRSITPEWMRLLVTPTLRGTSFVAPLYNRRKYDGTITNFLCYPVTTALYGKDIRQPIGGDFGLSIELVDTLLDSPLWELPDVSKFGIDIFETTTALAKNHKIKQALLGVKNHDAKDPSSQLPPMFRQVINTMFTCIENYQEAWKNTKTVTSTETIGENEYDTEPEQIPVSLEKTIQSYKASYEQYTTIYKKTLPPSIQKTYQQLKKLDTQPTELTPETWAKTVYIFITTYHQNPTYGRDKLIDALRVLWIGRVAHFIKQTHDLCTHEAEELITQQAKTFQQEKHLLLQNYQTQI